MSHWVGFTCSACRAFIKLGEDSNHRGVRLRYVAPLFPLMCDCGQIRRYRNEDLVDELGAPLVKRERVNIM
jgi:RNase P subunit RPR2